MKKVAVCIAVALIAIVALVNLSSREDGVELVVYADQAQAAQSQRAGELIAEAISSVVDGGLDELDCEYIESVCRAAASREGLTCTIEVGADEIKIAVDGACAKVWSAKIKGGEVVSDCSLQGGLWTKN